MFLTNLMFATWLVACSGAPPVPAKPPPVDPETRLERRPPREEPLKIYAPPPAYGNKIVMAGRARPAAF